MGSFCITRFGAKGAGIALALGLSAIAGPAAGQSATASGGFRWEVDLTGTLTNVRIMRGKVVRTRCITAFEEILADPAYRARLPEMAVSFQQPVEFAWNPNNLNYQSEYYIFVHRDLYELVVRCNLEQQGLMGMRSTLVVEARPLPSFKGGDLEDVVRTHMAWIRRRLQSIAG